MKVGFQSSGVLRYVRAIMRIRTSSFSLLLFVFLFLGYSYANVQCMINPLPSHTHTYTVSLCLLQNTRVRWYANFYYFIAYDCYQLLCSRSAGGTLQDLLQLLTPRFDTLLCIQRNRQGLGTHRLNQLTIVAITITAATTTS